MPRGCTEPYCADLGLVARGGEKFDIIIGGRGATSRPIHGIIVAEAVIKTKVPVVVDFILDKYRDLAEPQERLCNTIERLDYEQFIPPVELYQEEKQEEDEFAAFLLS
nr:hypothetical protein [Desulforamulus aquiferis]